MWFQWRRNERQRSHYESVAIQRVEQFRYLGSIIQDKEDIDEDINHRIKVG